MKKVLSLLLCAALLFGMIPATGTQAATEAVTADTQEDVSVSGTNSLGNLISQEITQSQLEAENEASNFSQGYSVVGLTIEGNVATVKYTSMEEANLIVAVYTEDNMQLLASGYTVVSPEETTATVLIDGTMPQYFMAAAYLVDIFDYSPLCPALDTPMYTRDMQELLASTIEDYDAQKILNLDDSTDNNFAVYQDSVVMIQPMDGTNTVAGIDYENNTYVIENADEQMISLTPGTIIAYPYTEAEVLIVKVGQIAVDGTTVTLIGADVEMEEVFAYMKLNTTGDQEGIEVDDSTCDEGITFEGISTDSRPATRAIEDDFSVPKNIEYSVDTKIGPVMISGGLGLSFNVKFSYYISMKRQNIQLETDITMTLSATIGLALPSIELNLGKYKIPTPVPGLVIDIVPSLVLEAAAGVTLSTSISTTIGFRYDSKSKKKFTNLSTKPVVSKPDLAVEGVIFAGLNVVIAVALVDELAVNVNLSAKTGAEITGELQGSIIDGESKPNAKVRHSCMTCIDCHLDAVLAYSVGLSAIGGFLEKSFGVSNSFPIRDFYAQMDSGTPVFGDGDCPNFTYRTTFDVWDGDNHTQLEGAVIAAENGDTWGTTNKKGVFVTYLKPGKYTVTITSGTETVTKSFKVTEARSVDVKIGGKPISLKPILTGVFDIIESITGLGNITDESEKEIDEITAVEPGVPYRIGAFCTGLNDMYYFNGQMLGDYAGATTQWENAVDVYFEEVENGYHMYFISGNSEKLYMNIGMAETYGYFVFSETPSAVYRWSDTYDTLVSDVDGITWFMGMHSPYEDFFLASVRNIDNHDVTRIYALGDGIPDGAFPEKQATRGVFGGEYGTQDHETYVLKTAYFKDLVPGQEYLLLSVFSTSGEEPLAPYNLRHVDQAVAREDGTLVFQYKQGKEYGPTSYVVACGATAQNLKDAQITFPVMCETDVTQAIKPTVVYNGKTLTEDLDYTLVGTTDFTEAGTYSCYVRGINNYSGLMEGTYTVLSQAMVSAWNLSLADQISVNFYLDIQDEVKDTAIVNLTLAGETVSYAVADKVVDEKTGCYVFSIELSAVQMTEPVTVTLVNGDDILLSKSYSVRQYADYVLSQDSGVAENVKSLVRELLHYGGMAQTYFDYNTENLASADIVEAGAVPVPHTSTGWEIITTPVVGKPLKMAMRKSDGTVLYFSGKTESTSIKYRLAATTKLEEATDVYMEKAPDGNYRLYFMNGSTKTYIRVFHRTDGNPGYGGGSLSLVTSAPAETYIFDTTANTLVYDYDGNNAYYMGTYGTYATFSVSNTSYITGKNASKLDVSQFPARFYTEVVAFDGALTVEPVGEIPGLQFYGASLVYRDRIALRYYFAGDVSGCTFAVNGNTYAVQENNGRYFVEVSDILPQNLDQTITITVTDAAGNVLSVSYGAMNYIVRMNLQEDAKLKNLLKALYNYHLAAKAI